MSFDPNGTGTSSSGIFALPYSKEDSQLILVPVPWEVTTSYGSGTAHGPDAIFTSSKQIDLSHKDTGSVYEKGIYWDNTYQKKWFKLNTTMKSLAQKIRDIIENGRRLDKTMQRVLEDLNEQNDSFQEDIYKVCKELIDQGKLCGLVGGDHSSPLGAIRACSESVQGDYSLIHIDAHADLRKAYQGFKHSHASIMRNVMESDFAPKKLIQIGIRDYCPEEEEFIQSRSDINTYFDVEIKRNLFNGRSWLDFCQQVLMSIPTEKVYISVDIDGLSPLYCPNTGTPVPGGLEFTELNELLFQVSSKKQIVGFDLCEVSPESSETLDGWDGNVGSRVLYNLCCYTLHTNA